MFIIELQNEFLKRVEEIINRDDLTISDKKSIIGKLFIDFEKRNKTQISKLYLPQFKEKRQATEYNLFMKNKMKELKTDIIPSKFRFKKASSMWKNINF